MKTPNLDAIPSELKDRPQWVLWRKERRADRQTGESKLTKVLWNARRGGEAKANDPATWSSFAEAVGGLETFAECDGIGYVFSADDPYVGIDLDGCADDEGELADWARGIVDSVNTYTEYSPSRHGVHLIARATLPPGRRRKGPLEMYSEGRYFTVTGDHLWDTPPRIEDRAEEIRALHGLIFPPDAIERNGAAPVCPVSVDDEELLVKALRSNPRMEQLWRGDTSGYDSHSEADLALCNHLAWWTGNDPARIERLFSRSGLVREKWERASYRQLTISKAVEGTTSTYQPRTVRVNGQQATKNGDVATGSTGLFSLNSLFSQPGEETDSLPRLADAAFHGPAGEFVRLFEGETEAGPPALLVSFLVAVANLIGPGPHAAVGATSHPLKLNALIVGPTAVGAKGSSWSPADVLLRRLDPLWAGERIFPALSSGEGLIWHVRDQRMEKQPVKVKGRPTGEFDEVMVDPGVDDKRLLAVISEFSGVLKVCAREGNTLSDVIREAWDNDRLATPTKTNSARATGAHVCIIGHVTPADVKKHLTETDQANGFANRFLWIYSQRSKFLPDGGCIPNLNTLVAELHDTITQGRKIGLLIRDKEAGAVWGVVYRALTTPPPGMVGAIVARGAAQALRLSALYAVLDGSPVIRLPHMYAALAVWDYVEESARLIFGDATGDYVADTILDALRNAPEGMVRNDIANLFSRHRTDQVARALELLRNAGLAVSRQISTGGRPAEWWYAVRRTAQQEVGRHLGLAMRAAEELSGSCNNCN